MVDFGCAVMMMTTRMMSDYVADCFDVDERDDSLLTSSNGRGVVRH